MSEFQQIRSQMTSKDLSLDDLALKAMKNLYLSDSRPWVLAFSGGKDSTLLLQLTYLMVQQLGGRARKPVYVVSSDTRVEAPVISDYLKTILDRIHQHALDHGLPIHVKLVQPEPEESFWGKLIGKGYPSPTRWFRSCTSNMKIRPSRHFIEKIVRELGSVILLLGTRMNESAERSKRIQARSYTDRGLNLTMKSRMHWCLPPSLNGPPMRFGSIWLLITHHLGVATTIFYWIYTDRPRVVNVRW